MIIQLDTDIYWSTEYPYSSQSDATKNFVNSYMNTNTPTYRWDESNRPNRAEYMSTDWMIVNTAIWSTPAPSCGVQEQIITVEGTDVWHNPERRIQVIMTYEDNLRLLKDFPEMGVVIKQDEVPSYIVDGFTYIYVNVLSEQERYLLTMFNAVINEREA